MCPSPPQVGRAQAADSRPNVPSARRKRHCSPTLRPIPTETDRSVQPVPGVAEPCSLIVRVRSRLAVFVNVEVGAPQVTRLTAGAGVTAAPEVVAGVLVAVPGAAPPGCGGSNGSGLLLVVAAGLIGGGRSLTSKTWRPWAASAV